MVIAGAAITLVRNASAGHIATLLSLLFTPSFSTPPLLSGCLRTGAHMYRRHGVIVTLWPPSESSGSLPEDSLDIAVRSSVSQQGHAFEKRIYCQEFLCLHIFISMHLQFNRARPKTCTVLTSARHDEGMSAVITHQFCFFFFFF